MHQHIQQVASPTSRLQQQVLLPTLEEILVNPVSLQKGH